LARLSRVLTGILRGGMAAILLFAYDSAVAGGYLLNGVGDRARAMGGAFTGLADDWSAAYYNPAGAAFLSGSEIYFGGAVITPRIDYVPNLTFNGWSVNNMPAGTYSNVDNTYISGQIGGFAKLGAQRGLGLGIAFYQPVDNHTSWGLFNPFYRTKEAFPGPDTQSDVNIWTGQPTLGFTAIPDRFSIGLGVMINYSEVKNRRVQLAPDPGVQFGLPPFPVGVAMTDGQVEGSGWGAGVNLGLLWKEPMWQLGLAFQSQVVHHLDGRSVNAFWTQMVDGRGELGDPLIEQDLLNGVVWKTTQEIDFELTLPPRLALGGVLKASDKLRFTGDFAFTWYSQVPGIILTKNDEVTFKFGDAPDSTSVTLDNSEYYDWKDQYRVAVGAEWDPSARLHFRFGYFYEPSVIEAAALTPLYWGIGGMHSPSVGASVYMGRYKVAGTYGLLLYEGRTVEDWNVNTNLAGEYSGVQHEVYLSLAYQW
jgi:long-chain fatty acid transport protein